MQRGPLESIRISVNEKDYYFTLHAASRMIERHISVGDVEQVLLGSDAEVIEEYSSDPRGPSCLVLGMTAQGRLLHVQCAYSSGIAVITAYEPDPSEWADARTRKGR